MRGGAMGVAQDEQKGAKKCDEQIIDAMNVALTAMPNRSTNQYFLNMFADLFCKKMLFAYGGKDL